jgi:aminopeptidase N
LRIKGVYHFELKLFQQFCINPIIRNMKIKFVYLVVLLFLASCGHKQYDETVIGEGEYYEDELFLDEAENLANERPIYRETETVLTDLIHTRLDVNFDWAKSRMNGRATITAKPHFYASDSLILDAKGMDILKVSLDNKALTFAYDSLTLRIRLAKTYTRDEKYTVVIDYVAKPDERVTGGSAAITSDKGLYFINPTGSDKTKMPQIWTQGETESSSVWFPTIDTPNAKTTQEIYMTVANKYATLSNGKLISSKQNVDGTRTDHWKQDLPHAPYLFMMGVGEFKVVKDVYTRPDGTKMDVNYYVESQWESSAKAIFGETPLMISYFSKLLGVEYPWDKYHQIVARDYVSGAMENTGAVVFGDFVYKTERELLDGNDQSTIAHELFHHWFGDLVTCESWSNLPLNESFANYSQYLWDEFRYGQDEADFQAEVETDGYYQSAQMQGYHNLIWFDYYDKEQMFDGHSYNKGGRILHMLRNHLGDDAFFKGIQLYLTTNKFKPAEFHQLRLAFEEVSGQDLNWFFNQWFLGAGHPVLDVNYETDTVNQKISVIVGQKQDLELSPIFRLPVDIAVYDSEGKHVYKMLIDSLNQKQTFAYTGELKSIVFDDQKMLLAKVREEKPAEQYLFEYYNSTRYKARKEGLLFGTQGPIAKTPKGQQLILDALTDKFWNLRLVAIEKAVKLKDENVGKANKLIRDLAMNDPNSGVRAAALGYLSSKLEDADLSAVCIDRLEKDQSYLVISAALKSLGKIDVELALKKAKTLESEQSSKMISGIAQLYGAHAKEDALTFFESALKGSILQGFDQLGVLNSLTFFNVRQEPATIQKSFELYKYMNETGGYYTKMFMSQNVAYLISMFETKITELDEEIAAHEKNNNAAYADSARRKKKEFNALKELFLTLPTE